MAVKDTPWKTVCIDLMGPYTFGKDDPKHRDYKYRTQLWVLTMIDPATGWIEIVEVDDKKADNIANLVEMHWLNRFPHPEELVLDRGTEFMGEVISLMRDDYNIIRKPITSRNPQANSIVERVHKTLNEMVRTKGIKDSRDLDPTYGWAGVISALQFGVNATIHTTTRATPGQLVFGRDMILNSKFHADWKFIRDQKTRLILQNNKRENESRLPHTYQVGDQVKVLNAKGRKHGTDTYIGPYPVSDVYDNGTVKLAQHTPRGGVVSQRWNIRNIAPYVA